MEYNGSDANGSDAIEAPGKAIFFRRTRLAGENDRDRELDGEPTANVGDDEAGAGDAAAPQLDIFAKQFAHMAEEAAARYLTWARGQAEAIIAAARGGAEAEIGKAHQTAGTIIADAEATAREVMRVSEETRSSADEEVTAARSKVEALLREAEQEAERTRQQVLLATTQEASALLEAKRAEAAAIVSAGRVQAEAEAQSIRERILSTAEGEAQRIREEAIKFSAETRQNAIAYADSLMNQLRAAALSIEKAIFGRSVDAGERARNGAPLDVAGKARTDAAGLALEAGLGAAVQHPAMGTLAAPATPRTEDISKILLVASPVRGFERLLALEAMIATLRGVTGVEVVDLDGQTARVSVVTADASGLVAGLKELTQVQSVACEGPALIRLTIATDPSNAPR